MRPQGQQPTRLPSPWDSPGKNTGVGCHFLLQCMKVKSESEVSQLCPTPSNPMDCSLPGSSIHGDFPGKSTGVGCHCLLLSRASCVEIVFKCWMSYTCFVFLFFYSMGKINWTFFSRESKKEAARWFWWVWRWWLCSFDFISTAACSASARLYPPNGTTRTTTGSRSTRNASR